MNKILEIGSRTSKSGRRRIELVLHKIHEDPNEVNRNGIHWSEENTRKNLESLKGIPICAEFVDTDKEVPLGHGYTETRDIDGCMTPVFENSEVCGSIDHGEIRDIEVNGEHIKALVGVGVLYSQRYPKFVQWVRENVQNTGVDTSVEISGCEVNDNRIVYEEGECSEKYRCPKEYDYSGTAIISVLPADADAVVLECAQAKEQFKGETYAMTEQEIKDVIVASIAECNANKDNTDAMISELNSSLAEKDAKIAELENKVSELETASSDKDTKITELEDKISELNGVIDEVQREKKLAELETALSIFSDEEKDYAMAEINSFKENPLEGSIDAIKAAISVKIVEKQKAEETTVSEVNSASVEDIFGEVSSFASDNKDEDTNIF